MLFSVTFTGKSCFNGPVPILSITPNQTTIRGGEVITFECLFGGNYLRDTEASYDIYWTIVSPPQEIIHVDNGSNTAIGYLVTKPSQHCQDTNNHTCCQFVSDLHINTFEISVPDKTAITCNAIFLEINSGSNTSGLSKSLLCSVSNLTAKTVFSVNHKSVTKWFTTVCCTIAIIDRPVLIAGPHDVTVELQESVFMTCTFTASEIPGLSICAWYTDHSQIYPSDKYQIEQAPVSGRDNEISCKLTVLNITGADMGKYYCVLYYNESFYGKYHVPEHIDISSQCGQASVLLPKSTDL